MRLPLVAPSLFLALAACGPPRASQFVGQDGSRDWWTVRCGGDEAACLRQASEACSGGFDVHELRVGHDPGQPLSLHARDGALPSLASGTRIARATLVLTCASATVPPRAVAGPECRTSPPRPGHCDEAAGLAFRTGRTYLPPEEGTTPAALAKAAADAPGDALRELRTIADGLGAEVAAVGEPIAAIDAVVKELADFPRANHLKPAMVKALAKAALGGKDLALPEQLSPKVTDDLSLLLAHVKAADAALRAAPDRAARLLEKVATRHARAKVLADAASAPLLATRADAHASAADRANADEHLAEVQELQVAARKKLDTIRTTVTELSSHIMQALAKLGDATS